MHANAALREARRDLQQAQAEAAKLKTTGNLLGVCENGAIGTGSSLAPICIYGMGFSPPFWLHILVLAA